jgi:uncharacterized glyoxalase superfamily protein PhnB
VRRDANNSSEEDPAVKKLTPVLIVDAVEPCLPFWVDRLGFTVQTEVPEGDRLGFAILVHGPVEVMVQSRASVAKDVPALAAESFRSALFVEVEDLAPILAAVAGLEVVVPERRTFYGAHEIGVRDPAGNVVTFARFGGE